MIAVALLLALGNRQTEFSLWGKMIEDGEGFKHRNRFLGVPTTSVTLLSRNQLGVYAVTKK